MYRSIKLAIPFFIVLIAAMLQSCEKEITVDLPSAPAKIVVEGTIFNDQPPIIFLSWTQGYFQPTSLESIAATYIRDENVVATISDGTTTYTLTPLCLSELPPDLQDDVSEILGIPVGQLEAFDVCAYTTFNLVGTAGTQYSLTVDYGTHHLESTTKIPETVELEDVRFEVISSLPNDSLGFLFANLTDPDTLGNAYRWFAKRINHYPMWVPEENLRGQQKDNRFIAPLGSVNDDAFFNGLSFEFAFYRGDEPNTGKFDDLNIESGFFKIGDTVVVRGCTMDRLAYRFINSFEDQIVNQGSPFAIPANLQTNVTGGLGAFIGYGAVYDTVACY